MAYIEYVIDIQGQQAVDAGYAFQGNYCYRQIKDWNGRFMGQLEVVLDDKDELFNGIPSQWVSVAFIQRDDIEKILSYLAKIGFKGCPCEIRQENLNDYRPDGKQDDGGLCYLII